MQKCLQWKYFYSGTRVFFFTLFSFLFSIHRSFSSVLLLSILFTVDESKSSVVIINNNAKKRNEKKKKKNQTKNYISRFIRLKWSECEGERENDNEFFIREFYTRELCHTLKMGLKQRRKSSTASDNVALIFVAHFSINFKLVFSLLVRFRVLFARSQRAHRPDSSLIAFIMKSHFIFFLFCSLLLCFRSSFVQFLVIVNICISLTEIGFCLTRMKIPVSKWVNNIDQFECKRKCDDFDVDDDAVGNVLEAKFSKNDKISQNCEWRVYLTC